MAVALHRSFIKMSTFTINHFLFSLFIGLLVNCGNAQMNDVASSLITVNPNRQSLIDEYGREMFFHGTNVVVKHFPWHPDPDGFTNNSFSEEDMELLQSLGINSVRLGMMLPGFQPKRGVFNETYLKVIQDMVNKAAKYGIYTLLDMHQDVMTRKFCVEGFPDWAVDPGNADTFPFPLAKKFTLDPKTGYPSDEDCKKFAWGDYYFTEASAAAFQNLYNNSNGLLDSWAEFWKRTAQGFRGNNAVIGYELINEPWAGDIFRDPTLMIPSVADSKNLEPAYDVVQKAIRQVDDRHCIFFEGVTWDFFNVGFSKVPGGPEYANRSVLSYHYYEPPDFSKELTFAARIRDLKRLRCGGFLTELLTVGTDFDKMNKLLDVCDEHMQSWMGWLYKPYGCAAGVPGCAYSGAVIYPDGKPNEILIQNTSRTYPQAVAGHTKAYKFDLTTRSFILVYEIAADCRSRQTIVYFNKDVHYSKGFVADLQPMHAGEWQAVGNKIVIEHNPLVVHPGDVLTFTLSPKS